MHTITRTLAMQRLGVEATNQSCAEQGKTGEWKEMAPHATEEDYDSILGLL